MIATKPAGAAGVQSQPGSLNLELLVARLKTSGLRVTTPRIAILEALANSSQPSTIEQLFLKAGG